MQVPIALLAALIFLKNPPKHNPTSSNWQSKILRIDFLGTLALILAIFTLIFAIETGSNSTLCWKFPAAISCFILSPILFGVFTVIEIKIAPEPFAPTRVMLGRKIWLSLTGNFFCFAAWLSITFTVPPYL